MLLALLGLVVGASMGLGVTSAPATTAAPSVPPTTTTTVPTAPTGPTTPTVVTPARIRRGCRHHPVRTLELTYVGSRPTITVDVDTCLVIEVRTYMAASGIVITSTPPSRTATRTAQTKAGGTVRTMVLLTEPGRFFVGATFRVPTEAMMPAWGGWVTVVAPGS